MLCVCLLLVIRWRGNIAKVPSMPGARWESRVQSDAWVYCIQSEQLAPLYFRTSPSEQPTLLLPAAAVHPIRYDAAHPKPAGSVPKEAPPARPSDGGCVHQAGLCTPCKSDTITPGHNLSRQYTQSLCYCRAAGQLKVTSGTPVVRLAAPVRKTATQSNPLIQHFKL